jgi:hypothetical protein
VGIVHRIVFVRTGSYASERLRIKEFPSPESGFKEITVSLASVNASTAYTGLGCDKTRTILGFKDIICVGFL